MNFLRELLSEANSMAAAKRLMWDEVDSLEKKNPESRVSWKINHSKDKLETVVYVGGKKVWSREYDSNWDPL